MIERVGVVGCGLMGSGIAEVAARAGRDVVVREFDDASLEAGRKRLTTSLDRGIRAGKLSEAARDEALGLVRFTTDFDELADRQLVVEAVVEDERARPRSSPSSTRSSPTRPRCSLRTPARSR